MTIREMNAALLDVGLPGHISLGWDGRYFHDPSKDVYRNFRCGFGDRTDFGYVEDKTWDGLLAKARKWVANWRLCRELSRCN